MYERLYFVKYTVGDYDTGVQIIEDPLWAHNPREAVAQAERNYPTFLSVREATFAERRNFNEY